MKTATRLIVVVLGIQMILSAASLAFLGSNDASNKILSLVSGAVFSIINFSLLVVLWRLIFQTNKKPVAWILVLIVIKYGILIGVFASSSKLSWLNAGWFAVGVILNPISVIISGLASRRLLKTKN